MNRPLINNWELCYSPCDLGKEIVTKKPTLQYKLLLTDFVDPGSALFDKKVSDQAPTTPKRSTNNAVVRGVQTDYRESEAQTVPWTPPYVFNGAVELIERARIKRQWEQVLMNDLKTAKDIETREKCIIDMETSEWLFREQPN
ncbi:hypothetical protein LSTR_LSTR015032 [Laodelphax striatellus]|uniref:Cilia- and flagella-associated protein 91 n=1 Tax=Laodelphax striatellus TaxID=195883 RepID=A0A482XRA6_LAOST|nr:hypothetical protein LSTR_LSTR015032 [Laodelphax striatellus]